MRSAALLLLIACGSKRDAPPISRDARLARPTDAAAATAAPDAAAAAAADAAPGAATAADAGAASALRPSKRCTGLPKTATVDVLHAHDGAQAFHVHTDAETRWLVFDAPKRCDVIPVGRADGRAHGSFWPGRAAVKAFAVRDDYCGDGPEDDSCPAAVAVRDDDGTMLDAISPCSISEGIAIHAATIFADQQSLIVSCTGHAGYGLDEELVLLHVLDGALRVVLRAAGGWGDHAPSDACVACKEHCWTLLDDAHWKVLERGAAPLLQTQAPVPYMERVEGSRYPVKNLIRWRFDPAQGVFVAEKRSHADTIAVPETCAPLPLRSPL